MDLDNNNNEYRIAFKETLCCSKGRRKQSKYREQSSIRETMVNHTSEGGHLVRVRSAHDRRNRIDHRVFRRCSYYGAETTALCSEKWKDYYKDTKTSLLRSDRSCNSSPGNNNDANQVMFDDKEDYKVVSDPDNDDSNISINISIHLHK